MFKRKGQMHVLRANALTKYNYNYRSFEVESAFFKVTWWLKLEHEESHTILLMMPSSKSYKRRKKVHKCIISAFALMHICTY